ncbi:hypothetical protein SELMODRAFT_131690 [Selaginella moellendorffii]|uniref:DUF218 domain-containing protein n=1 Tax=Selaginella moellendorffii TaxID=88036 RepID=D8T4G8_SELML|nr:hypothetical protein SELMODRAFT_131690 [Selaginella moellendorffii]
MENHPFAGLTSLVMVAGHAVYTSRICAKANEESSWFLEPYQRNSGQAATFLEHIHRGVEAASRDNQSLLLFSGGETRKEAGPRSEAQSYWSVADANDCVRDRAVTEEYARDSFENLLFSICRFRELTGQYPQNITVVSYHFKQHRFVALHRSALKFPRERFAYLGTLPAISTAAAAARGELFVQEQFRKDPYGCIGQLREKRIKRDPFARLIPYPAGCPEIANLFTYCGSSVISRRLPWN